MRAQTVSVTRSGSEQLCAIYAVARNELVQQTRYRTKLILDLFSPILALAPLILTAYFLTDGRESHNLAKAAELPDHFTFIMLGYMGFAALGVGNPIMHYTGTAWAWRSLQETGVLERNLLAPVSRETMIVGMGLYYAGLYLFHVAYLVVASVFVFGLELQLTGSGIATAGLLTVLMTAMAVLIGFLLSAVSLVMKDFSAATLVIHRPFLLLSGAYFLVDLIPQPFRFLAMANPLAYAIDAFRASLSSSTLLLPLFAECAIVAGSTVLIAAIGIWAFRRALNRQL